MNTGKTRFKKGNTFGGRKPMPKEAKKALSEATPEAIKTLISLLKDKDHSIRLKASIELINREYGKPKESHSITGDPDNPISIICQGIDLKKLPRENLPKK
jgi:hypothetical protein